MPRLDRRAGGMEHGLIERPSVDDLRIGPSSHALYTMEGAKKFHPVTSSVVDASKRIIY
jgi:hypothetical protein